MLTKVMEWKKQASKDGLWSWTGHGYVATASPALVTMLAMLIWPMSLAAVLIVYTSLVALMFLFYLHREAVKDESAYREAGTFDVVQGLITARLDKAGDLLCPFVALLSNVYVVLLAFTPWYCTLALLLLLGLLLLNASRSAIKRVKEFPARNTYGYPGGGK